MVQDLSLGQPEAASVLCQILLEGACGPWVWGGLPEGAQAAHLSPGCVRASMWLWPDCVVWWSVRSVRRLVGFGSL